jgi:hypothetical protein
MYLSFSHWVDGGDGVFFMTALMARKNHLANSNYSFNVLNLQARRDKRSWVNWDIRYFPHRLRNGRQWRNLARVYCRSRRQRGRGSEETDWGSYKTKVLEGRYSL